MRFLRYLVVFIVLLAGAGAVVWYGAGHRIAEPLMERLLVRALSAPPFAETLPDGLHVLVCGAGGPLPSNRSQTCLMVIAGENVFLVDVGAGTPRRLGEMRIALDGLDGVFLTHYHSDHIAALGDVMLNRWVVSDDSNPLPVYGPPGVEEVVAGFNLAYRQDSIYRNAHHGDGVTPLAATGGIAIPFDAPHEGESLRVFNQNGLTVDVFMVNHDPVEPAVGYRFEYGGRSVVISGDTSPTSDMPSHARGADLLLFEGLSYRLVELAKRAAKEAGNKTLEKIFHDIPDYHTDPPAAARIAEEAGVKHLAFYHIVPPLLISPLEDIFLEGTDDAFSGDITLTEDGMLFSLPKGSDDIEIDELL